MSGSPTRDRYGTLADDNYVLTENDGLMQTASEDSEDFQMSIQELLYSSSSYYAIAKPVTLSMVLAALSVTLINTDETREEGQAAMAQAYQVWDVNSNNAGSNLAASLANALVMVSVICGMTFMVVLLYRFKFMKCLIGYMIFASAGLLGVLGANLASTAIAIYGIPIDKISFYFFMFNFAVVGVAAIFWGQGLPKTVTQAYLILTAVILAWHLAFFDSWMTWSLLFMLAMYDLCAVLTPCGPLKALVNLMSQDGAPEMPGLLYEAELPPEAKRPNKRNDSDNEADPRQTSQPPAPTQVNDNREIEIPLAIARVYQLPVKSIPQDSMTAMYPNRGSEDSAAPLLTDNGTVSLPENPSPNQLRAMVLVELPPTGGRIEHVARRGRKVYLERDRHGQPKRILWVDNKGKVYAEMKEDDDEGPEHNSIRLGLGDFIFYGLICGKAAQFGFSTFVACTLVVLAGLGATLVMLSVYGHALPALPISIFLGLMFYATTRAFVEPWLEAVLLLPYYV